MHYIEVENLTFYYDDEPVLEDVSYYVDPGELVQTVDEKRSSSCGKSFEISGHVGNAPQTNWRAFWRAKATN